MEPAARGGEKALITGATGFIGRYCLTAAAKAGFDVHAVSSAVRPGANGVSWHQCDLLDPRAVNALLARVRPTHLLHLAWIAKPGVFWSSAENLRWLESAAGLFRGFYEHGGARALGVGTCAEYEWSADDLREYSSPLKPDTIYGRCKLAASLALEAAAAACGGSAAWARLFFPYGPGEPGERLIPAVIRGLLEGRPVDCTHGHQVRDFVFVEDVADGLVKMLGSPASGAFNIGSGRALTLREVVAVIAARLGGAELVRFGARPVPAGDPARVVADMERTRTELRWQPVVGIEDGIDRAIAAWTHSLA